MFFLRPGIPLISGLNDRPPSPPPPYPPPSECLDPPLNLNGVKQSCVSASQRSAPFNKTVLDLVFWWQQTSPIVPE